jgi:hypothetical protein
MEPIIRLTERDQISNYQNTFTIESVNPDYYSLDDHYIGVYPDSAVRERLWEERALLYQENKKKSYDQLSKLLSDFNSEKLILERDKMKYTYRETIKRLYNLKDINFIVFSAPTRLQNHTTIMQNITQHVNIVNDSLKLNQIICKSGGAGGGHYICYFRCNTNWYEYDDMGGGKIAGPIRSDGGFPIIRSGFYWTELFYNEVEPIKP